MYNFPVFSAYIYYMLSPVNYQMATSYIKAGALAASLLAGIVGDLLVVYGNASLTTLNWISAVSVCFGFAIGLIVLQQPTTPLPPIKTTDDSALLSTTESRTSISSIPGNCASTIVPVDLYTTIEGHLHMISPVNNNKDSSSSLPTVTTSASAFAHSYADKMRIFAAQFLYLRQALQSNALVALAAYWVFGNAVFMVRGGHR